MKKCPSYLLTRAIDDETFPELLKYFTMDITPSSLESPSVARLLMCLLLLQQLSAARPY